MARRTSSILAVYEVRKSSAVKSGASGGRQRPRRASNVAHSRFGSLAWEAILVSQYVLSFSLYRRCMLRTNCTQADRSDGSLVRLYILSCRRACRRRERHSLSNNGERGHRRTLAGRNGRNRSMRPVIVASYVAKASSTERSANVDGSANRRHLHECGLERLPVQVSPTTDLLDDGRWSIVKKGNGCCN